MIISINYCYSIRGTWPRWGQHDKVFWLTFALFYIKDGGQHRYSFAFSAGKVIVRHFVCVRLMNTILQTRTAKSFLILICCSFGVFCNKKRTHDCGCAEIHSTLDFIKLMPNLRFCISSGMASFQNFDIVSCFPWASYYYYWRCPSCILIPQHSPNQ